MYSSSILLIAVSLAVLFGPTTLSAQFFAPNECSTTESWEPVGEGLPGPAEAAAVIDDTLFVTYLDTSNMSLHHLVRWNGTQWVEVSTFYASSNTMTIVEFKEEIYIASQSKVIRWDGKAWQPVGDTTETSPRFVPGSRNSAIAEYNGKLYAFGHFVDPATRKSTNELAAWDGTRWREVDSILDSEAINDLYSLKVWNGELYVTGYWSGGDGAHIAAAWNGTSWRPVDRLPFGQSASFLTYNNELYALIRFTWPSGDRDSATQRLFRWDGATWHPTDAFTANVPSTPPGYSSSISVTIDRGVVAEHRGEIYGIFDIGSYNNRMTLAGYRWNGTAEHTIPRLNDVPNFLIDYHGELYAGGYFTSSCRRPLNHIARLSHSGESVAGVSGTLYHDLNGNCTRDTDEPGIAGAIVQLMPGPAYTTTDSNGGYRFRVPAGTYTLDVPAHTHWPAACPASRMVTTSQSDSSRTGNDFAFGAAPDSVDVSVRIIGGRPTPGRSIIYTIVYANQGSVATNGLVDFQYAPVVTLDSSSVPTDSRLAQWAEWTFNDLQPGEQRVIRVWMTVAADTRLGSYICASAKIASDPGTDAWPDDNSDATCLFAKDRNDSNDLQVAPQRNAEGGIYTTDSVLTYTIHIQKPGIRTASRVVVVDTLDPRLDPSTATTGIASHPFSFYIEGAGILTWVLDSANLTGANYDSTNSRALIMFSARLREKYPAGTTIPNTATIYFDFYDLPTNTVVSTIIDESSGVPGVKSANDRLAIYPNPAQTELHVSGELREGAVIIMRDLLGEIVRTYRCTGGTGATLDVSGIAAGNYLLAVPTESGTRLMRVTVAR